DRRGAMPGLDALATRLDADELHRRVVDERAEDPDGIGSTADARDDDVWRLANRRSRLVLGLASDDRLEVADHRRIWMRPDGRAEQVIGAPDVGDPVAYRLVHRVVERPAARVDLSHLSAQQLQSKDISLRPAR